MPLPSEFGWFGPIVATAAKAEELPKLSAYETPICSRKDDRNADDADIRLRHRSDRQIEAGGNLRQEVHSLPRYDFDSSIGRIFIVMAIIAAVTAPRDQFDATRTSMSMTPTPSRARGSVWQHRLRGPAGPRIFPKNGLWRSRRSVTGSPD